MDLSNQILTLILSYGAIVLGIVVFLAAMGLPFPSSVVVIACGAFVEQGVLALGPVLGIALFFVVLGDVLSYLMGRLGRRMTHRLNQSPTWVRAESNFNQRGGIAIFLTRCVLTPLAVPTNLLAGGSRFPFFQFLGLSASGEFTWLVSYGTLGYAFCTQWEYISDFVSNFSGVLVGIVILAGGIYWLIRNSQKISPRLRRKTTI